VLRDRKQVAELEGDDVHLDAILRHIAATDQDERPVPALSGVDHV
jgi:hypothetical protein